MTAPTGLVVESVEGLAEALYRAIEWSGCAGSNWSRINDQHRWRDYAATLVAAGAVRPEAEVRAEALREAAPIVRGWVAYNDGSHSPVERWVRAADGDWISLDSTRRTSGDILMDVSAACICGWSDPKGPTCPDCGGATSFQQQVKAGCECRGGPHGGYTCQECR